MTKLFEKLVLLFLFLIPLSTVYIFDEKFSGGEKWQFGTGAIYATELLLWLIFAIFIIIQIKTGKIIALAALTTKFKTPDYRLVITGLIWLFIFYAGLNILWASDKSTATYLWIHLLEAGSLFFILLISQINTKKIAGALLLSGAIQALFASQQFFSQKIVGQKWLGLVARTPDQLGGLVIEADGGRWLRASGTFNDPNLLSGFLALTLIAGCYFYTHTTYKKITLALITLTTYGLFFTFSRGSLIALTIGLLIWLLGQATTWRKSIPPVATIILTLVTLTIIFSPLVFSRANPTGRLEQKSIQERSTQNMTAVNIFKQHPLFGIGYNNYTYILMQRQPGLPAYRYQEVENNYLLLLTELGLVGFLIYLFLILLLSWQTIRTRNYWGLALFVAILTLGIFYHYVYSQFSGLILLWLVFFLTLNRLDRAPK